MITVFGLSPKIDPPNLFAISEKMKESFIEAGIWNSFVTNSIIAYKILWRHREMIMELAKNIFSNSSLEINPLTYLQELSFFEGLSEEKACEEVKRMIEEGPTNWSKKWKNFLHKIGF